MRISERDREAARRMLRVSSESEMPDLDEHLAMWSEMLHRTGVSGALGPQMLLPLLIGAGFRPREDPAGGSAETDWREVETDGSVRVRAYLGGDVWEYGRFLGSTGNGWYAVHLDGREQSVEVRKTDLRLMPEEIGLVADGTDEPDTSPNLPETVFPWDRVKANEPVEAIVNGDVQAATFVGVSDGQVTVKVGEAEHTVPEDSVLYKGRRKLRGVA